ncbi:MAG: glycosyltransferase family 4 protein [Candidatus Margulisiibacteriota bacterium]
MSDKPVIIRIHSANSLPFTVEQGAVQTGVIETNKFLKDDFNIHVFHGSNDRDAIQNREGVTYHAISLNSFEKLLPDYFYLKKCCQKIRKLLPQILHVHNRPLYVPYLRKHIPDSVKIVLHEHNHNLRDAMPHNKAVQVLKDCDHVIEISNFAFQHDIVEAFADYAPKCSIVHRGVNPERFRPRWKIADYVCNLKKLFQIPENKKVILYVGAIEEKKGIHLLLDAFKRLIEHTDDVILVIAGGSSYHTAPRGDFGEQFMRSITELGNKVKYLGFIPASEITQIYLLGDIFCAPSMWDEPFGLVFVEAQASGLPVVASARGGITDIIIDNETGLLVTNPEDTSSLAEKLFMLVNDEKLRDKIAKAGHKRTLENFTWERAAGKYAEIYRKLIK